MIIEVEVRKVGFRLDFRIDFRAEEKGSNLRRLGCVSFMMWWEKEENI